MLRLFKENGLAWLLMLTGVGTILLLMGSTVYTIVMQSFGYYNMNGESGFTLQYWVKNLQSPQVQSALFYSLKVATLGALFSIIVAYPICLWLRNEIVGKEIIVSVMRIPMFVTGLVAAFLYVNIISYHGILNQFFIYIGITEQPLRLQNDSFGWGIIILQMWKNIPFALILISGSMNSIRADVLDAASNLGASKTRKFFSVIVPLTLPAVQVALILIFIGALGDFAFYSIAGPRNTYALARLMQVTAMEYAEWNSSGVIAAIIMLTSGIAATIITLVIKPFSRKKGEVK
ncbi:ABC transporter permease subunit [Vibrio tarriae]|uniref:Spermidine/putrescine ABC transporter permease n=1 Tax=Vibrio tarriae TaxID=2014742 RepID=A0AAU8WAT6_9VIBR|nr:ABC transporter permease subunit [Vibrio tarriae]ASK53954.1 spermidine/putrescine ABC transporter permease [Vibrio tarriae]RBM48674.1 ABC transporter permease subunit [Vibrio tarriae]